MPFSSLKPFERRAIALIAAAMMLGVSSFAYAGYAGWYPFVSASSKPNKHTAQGYRGSTGVHFHK